MMQQLLRHQISNFQQLNGYFVSVGYKVPLGKKYYLSSKWIKGDVCRRILVLDTSLFIHFDDKHSLRPTILAFHLSKSRCIQTCFSIQVHPFLDKLKSSILEWREYTIKFLSQHNQSNPRAQLKIWSGSSSFCRHVGHPASRSCHERKQSGS